MATQSRLPSSHSPPHSHTCSPSGGLTQSPSPIQVERSQSPSVANHMGSPLPWARQGLGDLSPPQTPPTRSVPKAGRRAWQLIFFPSNKSIVYHSQAVCRFQWVQTLEIEKQSTQVFLVSPMPTHHPCWGSLGASLCPQSPMLPVSPGTNTPWQPCRCLSVSTPPRISFSSFPSFSSCCLSSLSPGKCHLRTVAFL